MMIKLNPFIFKGVYRKNKSTKNTYIENTIENTYVINNVEYCVLCEEDFYPPEDKRCWCSGVEDNGGDSFNDYCESIFEILDEEGYWE